MPGESQVLREGVTDGRCRIFTNSVGPRGKVYYPLDCPMPHDMRNGLNPIPPYRPGLPPRPHSIREDGYV